MNRDTVPLGCRMERKWLPFIKVIGLATNILVVIDSNPFSSRMVFQAVFPAVEVSREILGVGAIERLEPYIQSGGFKNVLGAEIGDGVHLAINQWRITNAG